MKPIVAITIAAAFAAGPAFAQPHEHAAPASAEGLKEPGQAAFAAIAEVVARLERDPSTDWSKVDVSALRDHLVDMDNVMVRSRAQAEQIPGGARFVVTAEAPAVVASVRRMVMAHARTEVGPGVVMTAREAPEGAILEVRAGTEAEARRLRALGFYGIVSQGGHHGPHHMMIASGAMGPSH